MAVTSDRRDTDTERHDKGNRHRAGRHTAGIEGHAPEAVRDEAREDEDEDVAAHEDRRKRDRKEHTQQRHDEKRTDAAGHGQDDRPVRHRRDLGGKHLQIRLRYGDDEAQEKGDEDDDRKMPALLQRGTETLAHRRHRHLGAQCEEHHTDDDQSCTHDEA